MSKKRFHCNGRKKNNKLCSFITSDPTANGWILKDNKAYCPCHIPFNRGLDRYQCQGITKAGHRCSCSSTTPTENKWIVVEDKVFCPLHTSQGEQRNEKQNKHQLVFRFQD